MHSVIEREGMIERYLLGQLSPEELDRFEDHYFECPECLEQLELAETLRGGIRRTAASDSARFLRQEPRSETPNRLHSRRHLLPAAALVLAGTAAGALLQELGENLWFPEQEQGLVAPASNTPVFFLGPERDGPGAEPTTRIRPRPELGGIVLALEVEGQEAASRFQVLLTAAESPEAVLWRSENLVVDHNGTLALSLPSRFLTPGDYWLQVSPMAGAGGSEAGEPTVPPRRFVFRILPSG